MVFGINNNFLYAVTHLRVVFAKGINEVAFEGTGFFVKKDKELYLITNRHVIDLEYKDAGNRYSGYKLRTISFDARRFDEQNSRAVTQNYVISRPTYKFASDLYDDIACFYTIKVKGSVELTPISIPYQMLADADFITNKLAACDRVALIGFPAGVWDVKNNLPILRSGVISSDPRLDYNNQLSSAGHVIGYEAFSTGGASGSPVFALQKGFQIDGDLNISDEFYRETRLIGINAASVHMGDGHQQMSLMYKANYIMDLIDACEEKKDTATTESNAE